ADLALTLADPARAALPRGLLDLRHGDGDEDGPLMLRGQACKAVALRRGETPLSATDAWRSSGYRASLFARTATGLTPA
ncbi:acyl-CoA synthetase, partial [Methylobacterium trifolii]